MFRSNLNVLGPINVTQNVTFDRDLVLTGTNYGLYAYGALNQSDGSLNVLGTLDITRNSRFTNNLDVSANLYVVQLKLRQ